MVQRLDGIPGLQHLLVARRLGPLPPIKGVGPKFVEYTAHPAPQDIQFVIRDSIEQCAAEIPFSRRPAATGRWTETFNRERPEIRPPAGGSGLRTGRS